MHLFFVIMPGFYMIGNYFLLKSLSWLCCHVSDDTASKIGRHLGKFFWFAVPKRRKQLAVQNILRAGITEDSQEAHRIAKESAVRFGPLAVSMCRFPLLNKDNIRDIVTIKGAEKLDRLKAEGKGCILAATIIAFPLMYRNTRAAFEQVDTNLIYAARTLGMSEWKIFWKVVIPSAGPGVLSGTVLAFARALGEYGATSMLAGNIPGKTGTVSQKIAMVIQDGDYKTAGFWSVVVLLVGFLAMTAMNLLGNRRKKNQKQW